jgi:hypothetical protein
MAQATLSASITFDVNLVLMDVKKGKKNVIFKSTMLVEIKT